MISTDNFRPWNWPSREEWAKQRRTCYADMENPLSPGNRVTDYASIAEIETAITELKTQWKRLGREMTEVKRIAGNLMQQPGETSRDYIQRWFKMTNEAQDLASQPALLRRDRKDINFVIRELYEVRLNWRIHRLVLVEPAPSPMLCQIWSRYDDACREANQTWAEQIAQTPIDDAAWEEELKWRADCENPAYERIDLSRVG
jgi:hypothetical protein